MKSVKTILIEALSQYCEIQGMSYGGKDYYVIERDEFDKNVDVKGEGECDGV